MSHLVYRNLAKLKSFDRDLNYTGIIVDDWNDPVNLIPPVLLLITLCAGGLPNGRGFQAWWALFNTALIHPMDLFVGSLGRGPKYLVDEYAVMDTRYWPLDNPFLAWISYIEVFIMIPLCFFWYRGVVQDKWYRHFCALLASSYQMMGAILYMGAEWHVGFEHLPTHDWPPTFDSYLKLKYFWAIFVSCNLVWVFVPLYIHFYTFRELRRLLGGDSRKKEQ